MSERIYIEADQVDPATPVKGCGCAMDGDFTVAAVTAIDGCALAPGDASPVGRCPNCDALVYIDTPTARAEDALRDLIRMIGKPHDPDKLDAMAKALEAAINAALSPGFLAVQIEARRGEWSVVFNDCDGDDTGRYGVMGANPLEAVAIAFGQYRSGRMFGTADTVETFKLADWDIEPPTEGYHVALVCPIQGGADVSYDIATGLGKERFKALEVADVIEALPAFDNAQAITEGWSLVDEDGVLVIRATQGEDHHAEAFRVIRQAYVESPYHCLALSLLGKNTQRQE